MHSNAVVSPRTSASLEHILQTRVRRRERQVHHERRQALDTPAAGLRSLFLLRTPPSLLSSRLSARRGLLAARLVGGSGARSLAVVLRRVSTFDSWLGGWRTRGVALVAGRIAPVGSVARLLLLLLLLLGLGLLLALRGLWGDAATRGDRQQARGVRAMGLETVRRSRTCCCGEWRHYCCDA